MATQSKQVAYRSPVSAIRDTRRVWDEFGERDVWAVGLNDAVRVERLPWWSVARWIGFGWRVVVERLPFVRGGSRIVLALCVTAPQAELIAWGYRSEVRDAQNDEYDDHRDYDDRDFGDDHDYDEDPFSE